LSPTSAIVAAAIALPLLLLLYFLKLRRRYMRVPSTLLWQQTYEDLEVNTPFQRLRNSPLLLLQLLLLAALLMAMARPVTEGDGSRDRRLILLVDQSASMNSLVADGVTRLDIAREQAQEMIRRLGRGSLDSEVMVISFGRSPSVVTSFTHDRRTLIDAIGTILPTDEQADLAEALRLAAGFAGHSEDPGEQDAEVVLFSDGVVGVPDASSGFRLAAGRFRFVNVMSEFAKQTSPPSNSRNVGITSFNARRDIDDPTQVAIFARLINTGEDPAESVITLRVDDEVAQVRRVDIPPIGPPANDTDLRQPGEESISFTISLPDGGALTLEHNVIDALPSDNVAYLFVPPPARPRIALVHPGDRPGMFIENLLSEFEPDVLVPLSPDEFDALEQRDLDAGELFDLIVFDRVSPARLPGIPTITFGGVPAGVDAQPPTDQRGRRILSWDRQHPVMRHVTLDGVAYRGFGAYELPQGATALARGPDGPVIALLRRRGTHHILVGFELNAAHTNWPTDFSIAVFMQNALEFLTLMQSGQMGLSFRPGETIRVRPRADARELSIISPDGEQLVTISAEPGVQRSLPALRRAGLYRVEGAAAPLNQIAVNMLSDQESDIRPRDRIIVNAEATIGGGGSRVVPRELWPWLVALALALLVIEWLMYCRRVSAS
jgi:hypothetical protein